MHSRVKRRARRVGVGERNEQGTQSQGKGTNTQSGPSRLGQRARARASQRLECVDPIVHTCDCNHRHDAPDGAKMHAWYMVLIVFMVLILLQLALYFLLRRWLYGHAFDHCV